MAWMTYYWMGRSLFLTISTGDHALVKEGLTVLLVEKNTNTQFQPLNVSYSIPNCFWCN